MLLCFIFVYVPQIAAAAPVYSDLGERSHLNVARKVKMALVRSYVWLASRCDDTLVALGSLDFYDTFWGHGSLARLPVTF
jgi:hypothetical protein